MPPSFAAAPNTRYAVLIGMTLKTGKHMKAQEQPQNYSIVIASGDNLLTSGPEQNCVLKLSHIASFHVTEGRIRLQKSTTNHNKNFVLSLSQGFIH